MQIAKLRISQKLLWSLTNGMSMTNAEKPLEYTNNLFIWSNHWATVNKQPKFFPAGPFFRMMQMKCLLKCPYFQKPPLPWEIPGYAPDIWCSTI